MKLYRIRTLDERYYYVLASNYQSAISLFTVRYQDRSDEDHVTGVECLDDSPIVEGETK